MLTDRDPHFALGLKHGRFRTPRYEFQDAEHQRRYLIGYEQGLTERGQVAADARKESLAAMQKLVEQMQRQQHALKPHPIWSSDPKWKW